MMRPVQDDPKTAFGAWMEVYDKTYDNNYMVTTDHGGLREISMQCLDACHCASDNYSTPAGEPSSPIMQCCSVSLPNLPHPSRPLPCLPPLCVAPRRSTATA